MADDAESSPEATPAGHPASGGTSPSGGPAPDGGTGARSPLDDLEADPLGEGDDPFGGSDPFGSDSPFGEGDPFGGGGSPLSTGSPALMVAKLWIRQNALLSVGLAFAAGTLIGTLKQ